MKKIFIILLILISFSCEDNLTNNIPAFQALLNGNNEWIAENYTVTIQNNQLSISGANQSGVISIVVDSPQVDQYNLYSWTDNFAVFQDTLQYSTQNDGIGSVAYLSDGFVQIQEIDNLNNTISGNFHFDAYNSNGEYTVNVSEGIFYKIPINSENQD
tara:strand:- start:119 stop:592 length:474 start_codon:yes stop_codon:yes gene_type:complete